MKSKDGISYWGMTCPLRKTFVPLWPNVPGWREAAADRPISFGCPECGEGHTVQIAKLELRPLPRGRV